MFHREKIFIIPSPSTLQFGQNSCQRSHHQICHLKFKLAFFMYISLIHELMQLPLLVFCTHQDVLNDLLFKSAIPTFVVCHFNDSNWLHFAFQKIVCFVMWGSQTQRTCHFSKNLCWALQFNILDKHQVFYSFQGLPPFPFSNLLCHFFLLPNKVAKLAGNVSNLVFVVFYPSSDRSCSCPFFLLMRLSLRCPSHK